MNRIVKFDIQRMVKSSVFIGVSILVVFIAGSLTIFMNQDINLGISIYGNMTGFKSIEDVILIGTQFYKGLGYIVAVVIAVFWGQEYLWKTLGKKENLVQCRTKIYLSKVLVSIGSTVVMYALFQLTVVALSGQPISMMQYIYVVVGGVFPYVALASVLAMITTGMGSNMGALIACIAYVVISEPVTQFVQRIGHSMPVVGKMGKYSVYGMTQRVNMEISASDMLVIAINSIVIVVISTVLGSLIFRKQEL